MKNKTFHHCTYGKCHIIGINSDGMNGDVVTFRYWMRRRQEWKYSAETKWILNEFFGAKI